MASGSGLDPASLSLMKRLDLAARIVEGEESAVDDFTAEVLRTLGYERDDGRSHTKKHSLRHVWRISIC
jgi:hypothetical protein